MEKFQIGIVRLGRGEVGYYDPLSKVHLTLHNPTANIYSYMNTSRLRRAVVNRTIELVAGTLASPLNSFAVIPEKQEDPTRFAINFGNAKDVQKVEVVPEPETKGIIEEEAKKEIPVVEEVKEEPKAEEPVVEEVEVSSKKAATTKKKKEEV